MCSARVLCCHVAVESILCMPQNNVASRSVVLLRRAALPLSTSIHSQRWPPRICSSRALSAMRCLRKSLHLLSAAGRAERESLQFSRRSAAGSDEQRYGASADMDAFANTARHSTRRSDSAARLSRIKLATWAPLERWSSSRALSLSGELTALQWIASGFYADVVALRLSETPLMRWKTQTMSQRVRQIHSYNRRKAHK